MRRTLKGASEYWKNLGPGLTTGAADDDPSGIATYSQAGAKYGFSLLWLAPLTFPLMSIVQEMCARLALVTGYGLAANIRKHYKRSVLYICTGLLVVANTFNIGADLGAMAKATQLLAPVAFAPLVIFFALISLLLQVYTSYKVYARFLKYLALVLFAYVITGFLVDMDWMAVLGATFMPDFAFTKEQIILICAILGTTISPYLFFWQTSQEIEEEILEGKTTLAALQITTDEDIKKMRVDVWSGMFISNLVMFFIIAVCAATLFKSGITNIATAEDAARALEPLAGRWASLLFTIGIIGTGMLAIPVLAGSSSYAISESFGWKKGLYHRLKDAYAFYGVIAASVVVGLGLNFIGLDPIQALLYAAIANGIVAPIMLFFIVSLSSSREVMGDRVNKPTTTILGWIITAAMAFVALVTIWALM